jgi:Domain of unknown function (DUF4388)
VIPIRGELQPGGFPAVLRPLVQAGRTGVLRLTRGDVAKSVYVSEGRLIFATSSDPDDRLGEMLLRQGRISYRALEDSVLAMRDGKRQGTMLVENGAIRARDLVDGVRDQVQEIIYSLVAWDDGFFEFTEGRIPSREVILLQMSTPNLLLEGIRRVDRWSRIRAGVGPLSQRYAMAATSGAVMGAASLQKPELDLVASLDGVLSVEEICRLSRQPDFVACRTIWALWAAGVLDRVPQDASQPTAPGHTEPHAERMRGASVGREIEAFNTLHRFVYELVTYELRDGAAVFFEQAFVRVLTEQPALFEGVSVDGAGELDPIALRRNIVTHEIARYLTGLDRLLEIEAELARQVLGEKKGGIIVDGIVALKQQQLEGRA